MNFFTRKTQSLKTRLLVNLAFMIIVPFALVMGINYKMTTDQLESRVVEIELPVLSNNLHAAIAAKLNIPATVSRSISQNVFVQRWLEAEERDVPVIKKFMEQKVKTGNLSFGNLICTKTGEIYMDEGYFRKIDPDNPVDQWYFDYIKSEDELLLVLSTHDDGNIMLFLDDKIRNAQGKLIGVVGLALDMNALAETLSENEVGELGQNLLVDTKGEIMLGKKLGAEASNIHKLEGQRTIADKVLSKKDGTYSFEKDGQKYLVNVRYFPEYDWYVITEACLDELLAPINAYYQKIVLSALAVFGLVLLTAYFYTDRLVKPIAKVSQLAKMIVNGDFNLTLSDTKVKELDELNEGFNGLIQTLKQTTGFAQEIAKGNLEVEYDTQGKKSDLGQSLINMRDELKRVEQEGKQRSWVTQGVAHFSELLRTSELELEALSDRLIRELVRYVGANQGAMFVLEDEEKEPYLEMVACYAYNRKKFLKKQVKIGEGLAGQAFLEKDRIYITDVPEEYIRIRSGLGDASPKAVLIVPMMLNEEVLGVIELATFTPFENYQIEFIEKVGEVIASTLTMVRNTQKMKALYEDSQQQAEMMKAQEEEMRQNMEELQATQEEMARKEKEYLEKITKLEEK